MQNLNHDGFWMDGFPPIPAPENLFEDNSFDYEKIIRQSLYNQPFAIYNISPKVWVVSDYRHTMPITFYNIEDANYISFYDEIVGERKVENEFIPFYTSQNLNFILFDEYKYDIIEDYYFELQIRLGNYEHHKRQGKLDLLLGFTSE